MSLVLVISLKLQLQGAWTRMKWECGQMSIVFPSTRYRYTQIGCFATAFSMYICTSRNMQFITASTEFASHKFFLFTQDNARTSCTNCGSLIRCCHCYYWFAVFFVIHLEIYFYSTIVHNGHCAASHTVRPEKTWKNIYIYKWTVIFSYFKIYHRCQKHSSEWSLNIMCHSWYDILNSSTNLITLSLKQTCDAGF